MVDHPLVLVVPLPVILNGHIANMSLDAKCETLADGSSPVSVFSADYGFMALLTIVCVSAGRDTFVLFFVLQVQHCHSRTRSPWGTNVSFSEIPVFVRGGVVFPLRAEAGPTTREVRGRDFEVLVTPGDDRRASGSLYVDDGESIDVGASTSASFAYKSGKLDVKGA
ncbi:hypothetical protein BDQ17DRAFT_629985 [Cyathus striatus]|nr:hypothetical protein BDQ17DRAFT_629985 [Cyathus striatus]